MQIVLEVTSGADAGRRALLKAGQTLKVGRTEWSDFAVAGDQRLSSVHFALDTDQATCYVQDLGSANGTLVNGAALKNKTELHHGDQIQAGETQFTIRIENAAASRAAPVPAAEPVGQAAPTAVAAPSDGTQIRFQSQHCDSGLTRFHGSLDEASPAELAARLSSAVPLHLIVDVQRLDLPQPLEMPQPQFLLDWLPEEARAQHSPVVLSASDDVDLLSLVDVAWGKDAVIGICSKQQQEDLLGRVRPAAGAFARPSVLAPQLTVGTSEFVANLLAEIDAVLVEGEDADHWSLFARNEFEPTLETLGFTREETDT